MRDCRSRERGSVTAEVAVVLPVVAVMLLTAVWAIGLVVANIRCLDAARDVARAVARGESAGRAHEIGLRAAPPGATVQTSRTGDDVRVVVSVEVEPAWSLLPASAAVRVDGQATVQVEPGGPAEDP